MNWFTKRNKEEEEKKARELAAIKSMEAEIRQMYEVGTARETLEAMYSKDIVERVVEQLEKEKALLNMLEAEAEAEASRKAEEEAKAAAAKEALHAEIRQLYVVGTQAQMLMEMYPADVVKAVVDEVDKEREGERKAEEEKKRKEEEEYSKYSPEERAEIVDEIKDMLRANTDLASMQKLYKSRFIQEAQEDLKKEKEENEGKEVQKILSTIQPHSKLVLHLTGMEPLEMRFKKPMYHVSCFVTDQDAWKVVFKSRPPTMEEPDWIPSKIPLQKLLANGNTETPIRIELLQEDHEGRRRAVGHATTSLPELVRRAVQRNAADEGGKTRVNRPEWGLAIQDRKHKFITSLVVLGASIYTHQETSEERTAKSKITKAVDKLENLSKLCITLGGVQLESLGEMQAFVTLESQPHPTGEWEVLYTSEPIHINPKLRKMDWKPSKISCKTIAREGADASPIRIALFDWNDGNRPKPLGSFVTTLNEILWRADTNKVAVKALEDQDRIFTCVDETYGEEYGSIVVREATIQEVSIEEKMARAEIDNQLQDMGEHARLHVSIRGDTLAKMKGGLFGGYSDPFFEIASQKGDDWSIVYRSEVMKDSINPEWKQAKISLDTLLSNSDTLTKFRISLFDWDENKERCPTGKTMGFVETTLAELLLHSETSIAARVLADDLAFRLFDDSGNDYGSLLIVDAQIVEETAAEKKARASIISQLASMDEYSTLCLELKGVDLANMDGILGVSDPFYIIFTPGKGDGTWERVYRSEHVDDNLNPVWTKANISLKKLLNGDIQTVFRIHMFDWEADGSHQNMGWVDTTLEELMWRSKANLASKSLGEDTVFVCQDGEGEEYGSIAVLSATIVTDSAEEKEAREGMIKSLRTTDENARLEITLRGTDLVNMDGFLGASDPFFEISRRDMDGSWALVYKSEHVVDSHNPLWRKATIPLKNLPMGVDEVIHISMTDWEASGHHQPMGFVETYLLDLLWSAESNKAKVSDDEVKTFLCRDDNDSQFGRLVVVDAIVVEDTPEEREMRSKIRALFQNTKQSDHVTFKLRGKDLANVEGMFGCSDPFVEFTTKTENGDWRTIYRSEHVENNLNPVWKPMMIPVDALLSDGIETEIRVFLFDWEADSKHRPMGYFATSIEELFWKALSNEGSTATVNDRAFKARSEDGEDFGDIVVVTASIDTIQKVAVSMKMGSTKDNASKSLMKKQTMVRPLPGSELLLTMKGINLENVEGFFGCSDPFFTVSVLVDELSVTEEWRIIFKSPYLENCLNPEWDQAVISMKELLQGGDMDRDLLISVFDWEPEEKHNPMGFFKTNLQELAQRADAFSSDDSNVSESFFTLRDKTGKEFGTIVVAGIAIKTPGESSKSNPTAEHQVEASKSHPTPEPQIEAKEGSGALGVEEEEAPPAGLQMNTEDNIIRSIHSEGNDSAHSRAMSPGHSQEQGEGNKESNVKDSDGYSNSEMEDGSNHSGSGSESNGRDGHSDEGSYRSGRSIGDRSRGSHDEKDFSGRGSDRGSDRDDRSESGSVPLPTALKELQEGSSLTLKLTGLELETTCKKPFFAIDTLVVEDEGEVWDSVYESEHADDNRNPAWKAAVLPLDPHNVDMILRVSIYDWKADGDHEFIGDFETTLPELLRRVEESEETGNDVIYVVEDEDENPQGEIVVLSASVFGQDSSRAPLDEISVVSDRKDLKTGSDDSLSRGSASGAEDIHEDEGSFGQYSRRSRTSSRRSHSSASGADAMHEVEGSFDEGSRRSSRRSLSGSAASRHSGSGGRHYSDRSFSRSDHSMHSDERDGDEHSQRSGSYSRSEHEDDARAMNQSDSSASIDPDKIDILRMYELGTKIAILEQMYDPALVAEVVAKRENKGKEGSEADKGIAVSETDAADVSESEKDGTGSAASVTHSEMERSVSERGSEDSEKHDVGVSQSEMNDAGSVGSASHSERESSVSDVCSVHSENNVSAIQGEVLAGRIRLDAAPYEVAEEEKGGPMERLETMVHENAAIVLENGADVGSNGPMISDSGERNALSLDPMVSNNVPSMDSVAVQALQAKLASLESCLADVRKENNELGKQNDELQAQNEMLKSRCTDLLSKVEGLSEEKADLQGNVESLTKSFRDAEQKNGTLHATCDEMRESVSDLRKQNNALQSNCETLEEEKVTLQQKTATMQKKITAMETSFKELQVKITTLEESIEQMEQKNNELEDALASANNEKEAAEKEFKEFQDKATQRENRFTKNLQTLTEENKTLEAAVEALKFNDAVGELQKENEQLVAKIASLEVSIKESEVKVSSANNLVASLSEAKKEIEALKAQVSDPRRSVVPAAETDKSIDQKRESADQKQEPTDKDRSPRRETQADAKSKLASRDKDRSPRRGESQGDSKSGRVDQISSSRGGTSSRRERDKDRGDKERDRNRDRDKDRHRDRDDKDKTRDRDRHRHSREKDAKDGQPGDLSTAKTETSARSNEKEKEKEKEKDRPHRETKEERDERKRKEKEREGKEGKDGKDRDVKHRSSRDDKDKDKERERRSRDDRERPRSDKDRDRDRDRERRRREDKDRKK